MNRVSIYYFLNFLPSLGWFIFMVLGALINIHSYLAYSLPLTCIVIIFLILMLADFICARLLLKKASSEPIRLTVLGHPRTNRILIIFLIISFFLILLRIELIGFDIIRYLVNHESKTVISEARILKVNNSGIRHYLFVLQNIGFAYFFPITAFLLYKSRSVICRFFSIQFVILVSLISLIGGERFPLFVLLSPMVLFLLVDGLKRKSLPSNRIQLITYFIISCLILSLFLRLSSYSLPRDLSRKASPPICLSSVCLEYSRYLPANKYQKLLSLRTAADTALESRDLFHDPLRRVFLIPSDVSFYYYRLFPDILPHLNGYSDFDDFPVFSGMSLPNVIGNVIYRAKYPTKYLKGVSAYGSYDADAYARFGLIGIGISTFLLVSLRLLCAFYWITIDGFDLVYLCLLSLLFWLPSIASIQAILLSYGCLGALLSILVASASNSKYISISNKGSN